jgi:hypothetical protein
VGTSNPLSFCRSNCSPGFAGSLDEGLNASFGSLRLLLANPGCSRFCPGSGGLLTMFMLMLLLLKLLLMLMLTGLVLSAAGAGSQALR